MVIQIVQHQEIIAKEIGVTVAWLNDEETSDDDHTANKIKKPPNGGETSGMSDEDLMFALFGGDDSMTEDDLAAVRRYVAFLKSEKNK